MNKTFDSEAPHDATTAEAKTKAAAIATRQRVWLHRKGAKGKRGQAAWRPVKTYRQAAKRFLRNVDNQLRVGSKAAGLRFFKFVEEQPEWAEDVWDLWPFI